MHKHGIAGSRTAVWSFFSHNISSKKNEFESSRPASQSGFARYRGESRLKAAVANPRDDGDVKDVRAVVTPPAFRSAAVLEGLGDKTGEDHD
jgi:hypothetical protein